MARVSPAPDEQVVPLFGTNAPLRVRIYAQRPAIAQKYLELGQVMREDRLLPDRLLELVRLRVAYWNQCRSCMAIRYEEALADGVTEALVCSLERPQDAPDLTEAERAAISFADLMATNHLDISDGTFERLREHFDEPEIVELCMNVALFVGFGRLGSALHMVDDLPEHFRDEEGERVTPWGSEEQVVVSAPTPWAGG